LGRIVAEEPIYRGRQPRGQVRDVEPQPARRLVGTVFGGREQIDQQRRQARLIEPPGHEAIPRTQPAAAAAVVETYHANGVVG
jgi:hypothetical protein